MTTVTDRLNELLEAERAGVETLSRLIPEAPDDDARTLFEQVRDDEAWSCAGLARSIRTLGGVMSEARGDFAAKVMAERTLAARLKLLNRGQGWVAKRLDSLIVEDLPSDLTTFLAEMKRRHLVNIEACDRLVERLGSQSTSSSSSRRGRSTRR